MLNFDRISDLLTPYLDGRPAGSQVQTISAYIDLLLRWNQRMNLTAVRDPEQIVSRHFGESLFAARHLLAPESDGSAIDVGSGAGFPGLVLKIFAPELHLTLIESHGKKATFLREICRSLALTGVEVLQQRAEHCTMQAELVTFRAVEHFESILPASAALVSSTGRLAALIGKSQLSVAANLLAGEWKSIAIPGAEARILAIWSRTAQG